MDLGMALLTPWHPRPGKPCGATLFSEILFQILCWLSSPHFDPLLSPGAFSVGGIIDLAFSLGKSAGDKNEPTPAALFHF